MVKIDELSGVELDRAVASVLQWSKEYGDWWWALDGSHWIINDREPCYEGRRLVTFSPHNNIAQAFSFVGLDMAWQFDEIRDYVEHKSYVTANCCNGTANFTARDEYFESDNSGSYATARCRAWLKAMLRSGVYDGE